MRKILILGMILVLSNSFGQTKNYIDQPYVETEASYDTIVKPDLIYLDILISEKDTKNNVSVEELETKMGILLQSLGIDLKKQLSLSDLSSNFKKYFLKQKDILKSKAYSLKVYDAQTAGKVIVELENIGISNVNLNKTEYSKMEELKLVLIEKASERAKNQANVLLKPLNQKISGALHLTHKFSSGIEYQVLEEVVIVGYGARKEYEPIEIEFKPIKITCEVKAKLKIE